MPALKKALTLSAAISLLLMGTTTLAADPAPAAAKGATSTSKPKKSDAPDENAKTASLKNSKTDKPIEAPVAKGGKKTRGFGPGDCIVHVDNWTKWKVQVYVDTLLRGFVDTYGAGDVLTGTGTTVVYGVAEFSDTTDKLTWGPQVVTCNPGSIFTWTLK